ncbi:MAG: low molecular weight protein-tyrosine-phosphatase [Duodenibacillus sp.]
MPTAPIRVLFVCLGNICRSPTAEGVFRALLKERGLESRFEVDSAGTGDWHIGQVPDKRATAACRRAGIDISRHRARLVRPDDLAHFDRILACDAMNLADLRAMAPDVLRDRIALLMPYAGRKGENEVPDPYYGTDRDFDATVERCRAACTGLLETILKDDNR